ncbi:hypothetical protein KI387_000389 [Taxus chinensis]|uniref:Chlorophyllase n=1 Tax=Taxus chinensis TaxID=29808 RepID=A0AA38LLI1_TAXCH|nr:hypothetical protein KI387_000389 [Taxus chinensis]
MYPGMPCLCARSEIKDAVAITNWLRTGLSRHLPPQVKPDLEKLAIAGHSRGGKVAFGAALERIKAKAPPYSAIIGVDPVDGSWPILPESLDLKSIPPLIIGSALGSEAALMFLPPCAPEGENHQKFFRDCRDPAYHFVATDYGHMDFLNDDTEGMRGLFTHCLCKKGDKREPMRSFTGGIIVAFLNASVNNSVEDFKEIFANPSLAPVKLEPPESKAVGKDVALA